MSTPQQLRVRIRSVVPLLPVIPLSHPFPINSSAAPGIKNVNFVWHQGTLGAQLMDHASYLQRLCHPRDIILSFALFPTTLQLSCQIKSEKKAELRRKEVQHEAVILCGIVATNTTLHILI